VHLTLGILPASKHFSPPKRILPLGMCLHPPRAGKANRFSAGGIDFLGELQEARPCGVTYAVTASLSRSIAFAGT